MQVIPCKKRHYTYIDILRIVAILAVLIQHSAGYYMDGCYGNNFLANAFRGATRWNILIFVLISGILFLGRDISLEMMWKKYIFRILKAFCIWSAAYTIYNYFAEYRGNGMVYAVKNLVVSFVSGGTNRLWYLVMLLGVYALIPLVNRWWDSAEENEKRYALIILAVVCSLFPTLALIHPINTIFGLDFQRIKSVFPGIYLFYLLLGRYMIDNRWRFVKKQTGLMIIAGGGYAGS